MRPRPPADFLDTTYDPDRVPNRFLPALDLVEWAAATFVLDGAPLLNEDHAHLRFARIGALWSNVENARQGRSIIGQTEFTKNGVGQGGKWSRARAEDQMTQWFGFLPDFVLTFYAPYAATCGDPEFCALLEHELYHCGQERDEFGAPRFHKSGMPALCLRGHDVEEFVGVVRRYGADAAGVRAMIEAAERGPTIARAGIAGACGNCLRLAA